MGSRLGIEPLHRVWRQYLHDVKDQLSAWRRGAFQVLHEAIASVELHHATNAMGAVQVLPDHSLDAVLLGAMRSPCLLVLKLHAAIVTEPRFP